jgi:hypothetical protein
MRWDVVSAPDEKVALARELVRVTPQLGWKRRALREASLVVSGDAGRWRHCFPKGARDAIWFISEVSDASMASAFDETPAHSMANVIAERLLQNADLKPFVRKVMLFDLGHPIQAVARMQRTAHVMVRCLSPERRRTSWAACLLALNLAYTAIVFVWLSDDTLGSARTRRLTNGLMRMLLWE